MAVGTHSHDEEHHSDDFHKSIQEEQRARTMDMDSFRQEMQTHNNLLTQQIITTHAQATDQITELRSEMRVLTVTVQRSLELQTSRIQKQPDHYTGQSSTEILGASSPQDPPMQLIRGEIRSGKSDKEIYKKLEKDFGETVLYAPKFDMQTAALWLSPFIVAGAAAGLWAFQRHRLKTNVHIMALNLVRGVPLTELEKKTMLDILTPPPPARKFMWWS
ncbi:hypothetical protein KSP40_PGU002469 [Platanthera guangdongensis]|uniref:Cytochrome c-type biogenesis protein n=1 Tax=Platanthera guangdongensis TaxID=2320717 RepID=A0ABR2LKT4_9ASPA